MSHAAHRENNGVHAESAMATAESAIGRMALSNGISPIRRASCTDASAPPMCTTSLLVFYELAVCVHGLAHGLRDLADGVRELADGVADLRCGHVRPSLTACAASLIACAGCLRRVGCFLAPITRCLSVRAGRHGQLRSRSWREREGATA
jgi:hypothetical protein